jgi:acyl carrier protein
MQASESDLKQVLADVFRISPDSIGEPTSVDTVEKWDSLQHLNLVLALEERFDVSFTEEETVEILSYPLIRAVLEEHGVRFVERVGAGG